MATPNAILRRLRKEKVPYGTNELRVRELYKQRNLYKSLYINKKNTIDFWYERTLYGRVDPSGNSIYPTESNFKEFRGSKGVYALNFVVDAYDSFVDRFISQHQNDRTFPDEPILSPTELVPKKAWSSINVIFHKQVGDIYDAFVNQYLNNDPRRAERIVSFREFVDVFLEFFEMIGTKSPLTRTGIISSLRCVPNISGLCVEFALEDYSVDYIKHRDIFNSKFYRGYLDAAKRSGFFVDRNAPWRLVADLDSKNMQHFMYRYGTTLDNLHRRYYIKSYLYDIPALRTYFKQFYKSFIAARPLIKRLDGTTVRRIPLTNATYEKVYKTDYWLWLYAKIRQSEVIDKMEEADFNRMVKKARNIRKYLDIRKAVGYINSEFLGQLVPTV